MNKAIQYRHPLFMLLWLPLMALSSGIEILPFEGQPQNAPAQQVVRKQPDIAEWPRQIRISTYNIQDFAEGREKGRRTWENAHRQTRIAAAIVDEIGADVLLLQEVETPAMLELLNNKLENPFPYGGITALGASLNRRTRLNLAMLSRFPLQEVTEIDFTPLEGPGRPTRGLLRAKVQLDADASLLIYNLHLKANWGDQQRNQSQRYHALMLLQEDLARCRDNGFKGPALIAGDFNFDPSRPEFKNEPALALLTGFKDLWKGVPKRKRITIPARQGVPSLVFPPVAFDRFYFSRQNDKNPWRAGKAQVLSKGVDLEDNRKIAGEDETTASDHYPLFFDLYSLH